MHTSHTMPRASPGVALLSCASDLLKEHIETWNQVVYSYQLSVLDADCWCYSATNMHDYRFDVARVSPRIPSIRLLGPLLLPPTQSALQGTGTRAGMY